MKKLIIIGASGHGKVVADIARLNGYKDIVFLDDNESLKRCGRYAVIGKTDLANSLDGDLFVGIGNPSIRKRLCEQYENQLICLIHPDAVIADDVEIDTGTVVMAGTVINSGSKIGKGCIVNTSSSIDHDCRISDYVHVSVGAHIAGTVTVGEGTWVGAGAVIRNGIEVCGQCMIGVGAVVVKNVTEQGTYVGVPVKAI